MSDIIQFDFEAKRRKQESWPSNGVEKPSVAGEIIEVDFAEVHQEAARDLWAKAMVSAGAARKFLSKLKKPRTGSAVEADSSTLVDGYNASEIMTMIVNSSETDWMNRPTFYRLLLLRFDRLMETAVAENYYHAGEAATDQLSDNFVFDGDDEKK